MRLYISIASNRDWKARFGTSLAFLTSYLSRNGVKGHTLESFTIRAYGQASCLSIAQEKFVEEAIQSNHTHWLSLDDDMTFPDDIVDCLASHDKDVVCTNYRHKHIDVKGVCCGLDGSNIDSSGRGGIEKILTMGGASFLAKVEPLKKITKPLFEVRWLEDKKEYMGSDVYFSCKLKEAGIDIYCDHDLSQRIGHIGEQEYKFPQKNVIKLRRFL